MTDGIGIRVVSDGDNECTLRARVGGCGCSAGRVGVALRRIIADDNNRSFTLTLSSFDGRERKKDADSRFDGRLLNRILFNDGDIGQLRPGAFVRATMRL